MRDFYDIYILQKLYGEQLSKNVLWVALVATVKKRGTLGQIEAEYIDEVLVMDAVRVLYQTVYAERNGTHD